MAVPDNRPVNEWTAYARTTSIGATPAACSTVAPVKGLLHRAFGVSEGSSTGTITTAVAVRGVSSASFAFTGGANSSGEAVFTTPISVNEGDLITFTPSGGGVGAIPGHYYAVIRGG